LKRPCQVSWELYNLRVFMIFGVSTWLLLDYFKQFSAIKLIVAQIKFMQDS
jgi:hypothetical protein